VKILKNGLNLFTVFSDNLTLIQTHNKITDKIYDSTDESSLI